MEILGEVAEYLRAPALDSEAAEVLSKIWHRHPNRDPAIEELMLQGCRLLVTGTGIQHTAEAEKIFSHMIHLDPSFAEARTPFQHSIFARDTQDSVSPPLLHMTTVEVIPLRKQQHCVRDDSSRGVICMQAWNKRATCRWDSNAVFLQAYIQPDAPVLSFLTRMTCKCEDSFLPHAGITWGAFRIAFMTARSPLV